MLLAKQSIDPGFPVAKVFLQLPASNLLPSSKSDPSVVAVGSLASTAAPPGVRALVGNGRVTFVLCIENNLDSIQTQNHYNQDNSYLDVFHPG